MFAEISGSLIGTRQRIRVKMKARDTVTNHIDRRGIFYLYRISVNYSYVTLLAEESQGY
jgi:hypothetical protein